MTDRRSGKAIFRELGRLVTEQRNPRSKNLDRLTTTQILMLMNREDRRVPAAVGREIRNISRAVDLIVERLARGGRLFYVGAGTSGRLGVLDATECPPTFGTPRTLVQGIIAGGRRALVRSVEGAEDDPKAAAAALKKRRVSERDVVVGIMASRRTPYAVGALKYGRAIGAATIAVTANPAGGSPLRCDVIIAPRVGPEVLTGSTRLKAGTAQKLVLNMLTTGAMVRLGKVYENLMVDLKTASRKLEERTKRVFMNATGASYAETGRWLKRAGGSLKVAIVMRRAGVTRAEAERRLKEAQGWVREAIRS
ncbi:MAG: N-acetylmuramic acid 6-phosphate etherase [Candidatus Eisenbacteria bacterium]|uniref:N-acetylmuramic acid 6-phosphate etherase n=1 Tax=Eiseniibacteriota bacterium TaxID=2212470 RepID=A0A538TFT2_UNCEI|nr:MAG: N-acetylmuramic acid 6-phosphate etherase [Candidatus Eisenbacteria bacterium]